MANLPNTAASTTKLDGSLISYAPANVRSAMKDRMSFSDAIERVGRMLKSYPPSEGIEIGGYVGMLAATLLQYPKCVAVRCADPIKGVVSTTRFKPTVADLTAWCEREMAGLRTIVDRDDSEKKMLADRKMALEGEREMAEARKRRPNLEDLRKKHGQNWGIRSMGGDLSRDETAPLAPRAAADQAAAERKILAEYARVGKEPFRAGNLLISPSLVAALKGHR